MLSNRLLSSAAAALALGLSAAGAMASPSKPDATETSRRLSAATPLQAPSGKEQVCPPSGKSRTNGYTRECKGL